MKKNFFIFIMAFGLSHITNAQVTTVDCDLTDLTVNVGTIENYVNIYHSGHYLTSPHENNVIAWEITDTQGNLITQETLVDDAIYAFYHDIPITDTMNVSAHLTNDSAIHEGFPVSCLIEDQLYWEITEVISGVFTGSWTFVHGSVGMDQNSVLDSCIANPIEGCMAIEIWDPVCGCDGLTYSNSMIAACNSILNSTPGECLPTDNFICTSNSGIQILEVGYWENLNDPCETGECTSDGQFLEIVIDCMEEMGLPCSGEWIEVEGQCCSECVENVDLNEITNEDLRLIKMIDILGRKQSIHKSGQTLFYIYENGKVVKRIK